MTNDLLDKKINIADMIHMVRGKQVIFDFDLALLYKCKYGTKEINQAVKRNPIRFPNSFMFKLSDNEFENLRSQIVTANLSKVRSNPHAFTEEGVAMLSSVLRTRTAAKTSVEIMKAFVSLKHYVNNEFTRLSDIEIKLIEHDNRINDIFKLFDRKYSIKGIYFKGETFEAYSDVLRILCTATKNIIIIDNYSDNSLLDIMTKVDKRIKLYLITDKSSSYLKDVDIDKYNQEFGNLNVIYNKEFHDRYIIIDKSCVYYLGSSIRNLGSKVTSVNLLSDNIVCSELIKKVKDIINKNP